MTRACVYFAMDAIPEVRETNREMHRMDSAAHIGFLKILLSNWGKAEPQKQNRGRVLPILQRIFGHSLDDSLGDPLIFIQSADKRTFECWCCCKDGVTPELFEISKHQLLFTITGNQAAIEEYTTNILYRHLLIRYYTLPDSRVVYGLSWN